MSSSDAQSHRVRGDSETDYSDFLQRSSSSTNAAAGPRATSVALNLSEPISTIIPSGADSWALLRPQEQAVVLTLDPRSPRRLLVFLGRCIPGVSASASPFPGQRGT